MLYPFKLDKLVLCDLLQVFIVEASRDWCVRESDNQKKVLSSKFPKTTTDLLGMWRHYWYVHIYKPYSVDTNDVNETMLTEELIDNTVT